MDTLGQKGCNIRSINPRTLYAHCRADTRWQTKSHSTAPSALSSSQLRVRIIRDHMQYYTLLLVEFYLVRK